MFKNKKNKNKIKFFLKKICIKIKNLPKNPETGGTPANDNKIIIIDIETNCKLYAFFKLFKLLTIFVLNKKIIKKTFNIDIT